MVYTYTMEYYSNQGKEQNNVLFAVTDGPTDCHTEWRIRKDNMSIYIEPKKMLQNEPIYKTNSHNEENKHRGKEELKGKLGDWNWQILLPQSW